MNLFYAAFIPGLQNVIEQVIKERLSDVVIHKLLDGAVIFETKISYDKLNFFCFNNIFAVINITDAKEGFNSLEKNIKAIINNKKEFEHQQYKTPCASKLSVGQQSSVVNFNTITNNSKSFKTFRIIISNENKPAAIDEKLRVAAEKFISSLSGLKVNRSLPDTEFWFLYRREGFSVFMKRLTLKTSWDKTLHKGELPPPLTWTLCRLAGLKHSDTVLDPFCGYGSIPDTAIKHFHVTNFITCDNNKEAASFTAVRFKNKNGFTLYKNNFYELPSVIAENSIDAIVTDPPWGQYREINDSSFLIKMFSIFDKLLKPGGRAVVLYANDDNFVKAIPASFNLQNQIPILLSGKKAVIYILEKSSR